MALYQKSFLERVVAHSKSAKNQTASCKKCVTAVMYLKRGGGIKTARWLVDENGRWACCQFDANTTKEKELE